MKLATSFSQLCLFGLSIRTSLFAEGRSTGGLRPRLTTIDPTNVNPFNVSDASDLGSSDEGKQNLTLNAHPESMRSNQTERLGDIPEIDFRVKDYDFHYHRSEPDLTPTAGRPSNALLFLTAMAQFYVPRDGWPQRKDITLYITDVRVRYSLAVGRCSKDDAIEIVNILQNHLRSVSSTYTGLIRVRKDSGAELDISWKKVPWKENIGSCAEGRVAYEARGYPDDRIRLASALVAIDNVRQWISQHTRPSDTVLPNALLGSALRQGHGAQFLIRFQRDIAGLMTYLDLTSFLQEFENVLRNGRTGTRGEIPTTEVSIYSVPRGPGGINKKYLGLVQMANIYQLIGSQGAVPGPE